MERLAEGEYLTIPTEYLRWLGGGADAPAGDLAGLHWSMSGDAIEYADGSTFIFSPEIAQFLEGLGTTRTIPHFGYVLHLLHILRQGLNWQGEEFTAVAGAFVKAGRPLRNAGVLCGLLTVEVPALEEPVDAEAVCRQLASFGLMSDLCARGALGRRQVKAARPPVDSSAFETIVRKALAGFRREDLEHWFRHGRGPLNRAGQEVAAEVVAVKPRSLEGMLAALAQRKRFAGAALFVPQLVSALSLPPRRLAHPDLPLGGYADLATRGHPEQILPSQFALEDLEFLRRFAEHELLFFRREEPQSPTRETLVVLLDQGVRTWGDVRLVLSAAVLAFGKAAARRRIPFRIAATSSDGRLVDPLQVDDEALGQMLEASDLSPHPGLALERVLEERAEAARDVVLLTHPRNLQEADVAGAARRAGPGTRLFAVGVDGHGGVLLAALKHGVAVKVCQFKVDLTLGAPPPPPRKPEPVLEPLPPWTGDTEPIGFPFRFGLTSPVEAFDLDYAGDWLLTASHRGVLHAWKTDGTRMEVLPRGFLEGEPLTQVERVLGVADGFIVGGRVGPRVVAVHYDFPRRTVASYWLGPYEDYRAAKWFYFREFHTVVLALPGIVAANATAFNRGIDLATGERNYLPFAGGVKADSRLSQALAEVSHYTLPPPCLPVVYALAPQLPRGPFLYFDQLTGSIVPHNLGPAWGVFTPEAEGRLTLKNSRIVQARLGGTVLALVTNNDRSANSRLTLRLFRGPDGTPLAEYPTDGLFALSGDGRRLARPVDATQLEVRDSIIGGVPLHVTAKGKAHQRLYFRLGKRLMTVRVGHHGHLFNWNRDELQILRLSHKASAGQDNAQKALQTCGTLATEVSLPRSAQYDPKRFVLAAHGDVSVVSDAYGQLAVFDPVGVVVCMFFVFRDQAGAWMPDGTRHGPPSITGGPPTPGALAKLGQALRDACARKWRPEP